MKVVPTRAYHEQKIKNNGREKVWRQVDHDLDTKAVVRASAQKKKALGKEAADLKALHDELLKREVLDEVRLGRERDLTYLINVRAKRPRAP